jgi:hypothetical protein
MCSSSGTNGNGKLGVGDVHRKCALALHMLKVTPSRDDVLTVRSDYEIEI